MSLTIKVFSLIVASILASFGILYNDISMLMAASLISPLVSILNDITLGLVNVKEDMQNSGPNSYIPAEPKYGSFHQIFFNVATLFAMVAIAFVISLRIPKTKKDDPTLLAYAFVGLLLGVYTTYISSFPATHNSIMQLVGVSLGIIILSPIIRIGISLGQEQEIDSDEIKKNIGIVLANTGSFLIGATAVHSFGV
jgi:hypothetical protein